MSANTDGNWILKIDDGTFITYVLVDFLSREIIGFTNHFGNLITQLSIAGGFRAVHGAIADLEPYRDFFSNQDISILLNAAISNDQIYQIAKDEDVNAFFADLYETRQQLLNTELREQFEIYFLK